VRPLRLTLAYAVGVVALFLSAITLGLAWFVHWLSDE
jgi:hypothetical protein